MPKSLTIRINLCIICTMKIRKVSKKVVGFALCSSLIGLSLKGSAYTIPFLHSSQNNTVATNTLWANISQHFTLNHEVDRGQVMRQIAWLQQHQQALYNSLQAAAPYISYIYQQTQKHGVPAELALLPMIESQCNPLAKSGPGASGVWQIMPKTGKNMGLTSNSSYDGRRDVVASTDAALNYLTFLHQSFHQDWEVALAAYNWGPGNVDKQVHQQSRWYRTASFWELNLPAETANYVPKLLALAEVVQHPDRYHIRLPNIPNGEYLQAVHVSANVNLKQLAQTNGISSATMQKFNPGYIKMATTRSSPNTLLVPTGHTTNITVAANEPAAPQIAASAQPQTQPAVLAASTAQAHLLSAIFNQGKWLAIGA